MRYTYYCPYLGLEHLMLIKRGWKELHCLFIDGEVWIKVVSSTGLHDVIKALPPQGG